MPNNNNGNGNNNNLRARGIKNTCCPENNNNGPETPIGGKKKVRFSENTTTNTPPAPPTDPTLPSSTSTSLYPQTTSGISPSASSYYSSQPGMPGVPTRNTPSYSQISTNTTSQKIVGAKANNGLPSYNNVVGKSKIKSNNNTSVEAMNNGRLNNGNNTGNNNNNNANNRKVGLKVKAKQALDKARKSLLGETGKQLLIIIVVALLTFILMYFVRKWLLNSRDSKKYAPYLIEGSKSGKSSLVLSTNPNEEGSVPLYRSDNQDGAEFTYSFWMLVDSMEYNYGKWKHVFHRGNKTSFPNRAPGVWLHPETNTLRVYMNTYEDPLNYVDIENIPIRKWFHASIVLNHKYLDIYFNGKLRHRKELKSAPRQNYGPFWAGLFGGFEGYLSKVRYHNKALEYNEIEKIVKDGPSRDACGDTGDYPPYLDDAWWFDMKV